MISFVQFLLIFLALFQWHLQFKRQTAYLGFQRFVVILLALLLVKQTNFQLLVFLIRSLQLVLQLIDFYVFLPQFQRHLLIEDSIVGRQLGIQIWKNVYFTLFLWSIHLFLLPLQLFLKLLNPDLKLSVVIFVIDLHWSTIVVVLNLSVRL